ncbi:MAG: helix-turn-helix transcriptional regulator [Limnohabitans sp.]|nr:helix-turn-helix transcriptional regulator [Limnohabitans sp.]
MNSIGERLTYAINIKGLNANKVSLMTKIHATTVNNYMKNKGKPDLIKLEKISKIICVDFDWLINGGDIIRIFDQHPQIEEKKLTLMADYATDTLLNIISEQKNIIAELKEQLSFYKDSIEIMKSLNNITNSQINDIHKIVTKNAFLAEMEEIKELLEKNKKISELKK